MPPSIEEAFNNFKRTLDDQLQQMNIASDNNLPSTSPDRQRNPGGFFTLPPQLPSSSESEDGDVDNESEDNFPTLRIPPFTEAPNQPPHLVTATRMSPIPLRFSDNNPLPLDTATAAASIPHPDINASTVIGGNMGYKLNYGGFSYTRKNSNKKSTTYWCMHKRGGKIHCNGVVKFLKDPATNEINLRNPDFCGTAHTYLCCQKNDIVNMDSYQWEGRKDDALVVDAERPVVTKFLVSVEMSRLTEQIATSEMTLLPKQVWQRVRAAMNEAYPYGWSGLYEDQVCEKVRKARSALGLGDAITTVTNVREYRMMKDTERPFLQAYGCFPHPEDPKEFMSMMVFGNPTLIQMLKVTGLDIFVDATFDCTPRPFYQTLILMTYHEETESYVPVLYALMTHKNSMLYWIVLHQFIVTSGMNLRVRTYTSDFEIALFTQMGEQFGGKLGGKHVGCLFHLKQAWRKYLIEQCKFSPHEIEAAMATGGLDTLTIIPRDEISLYGIPFLRSVLEKGADSAAAEKWETFWTYFERQWMNKIPSWNILDDNGEYIECRNYQFLFQL